MEKSIPFKTAEKIHELILQLKASDTFFKGVRWMGWLQHSKSQPFCKHYKNIDHGIECAARNCPCDLYDQEIEPA